MRMAKVESTTRFFTDSGIFGFTAGEEVTATNLRDQRADLILDALIGYGLESAPHVPRQN